MHNKQENIMTNTLLNRPDLLKQAAYINGEWIDSNEKIEVSNPATGEVIGHIPKLGTQATQEAIKGAQIAQKEWAKTTAKERSIILQKWFDLMMEHQDDLGKILTLEQGKPLSEAKGEIAYGASFVEWFAQEARRAYGETVPGHMANKRILVIKQPIGVVAAITPWNFPNAMITRKAAPAFAAGCAMVLKPAAQTPFSALALAVLAEEAGIPKGLFSVVTGSAREIGGVMTSSPIVRKLTFTGSTEVGAMLYAQCAPTIKKLGLELGGNAPFLVFNDADIEKAIEGALIAKFRNNGQTCVCANRIYVQAGVYDAFAEKFAARMTSMKTGNGMDEDTNFGPLIDQAAVDKVKEHIQDATTKGAKIAIGGKPHELGGTYFQPTVLTNVTPDMIITHEETFGPVAPLFKFRTEEEAIELANNSEFGLASYFFTQDHARVWRVSEALEYGMVGVNTGLISAAEAPFGGVKLSGLGREGGHQGMEEFMETKYICMEV